MIKNFNIKILPVFFILFLNLYTFELKAVEKKIIKDNRYTVVQIHKAAEINKIIKKGFLKRFFKKTGEKVKEIKRRIVKKIKRFFSKRKAKKDRMKSSFKNRHHNLFNILIFSGIFFLLASGIAALFLSGIITSSIFIILSLALLIPSIVIALIYFSNRYIVKPHYRN